MADSLHTRTELAGDVIIATILSETVGSFELPALEKELRAAGLQSRWRLAIDLSHVMILGSAGLGLLLGLRKEAKAASGQVVLFSMSPEIHETLKITKLDSMFKIAKDRASALKVL